MDGEGEVNWPDRTEWEGRFEEGVAHGKGTMTFPGK